jgi:predicted transcriptional regulator of viral defense system
MSAGPAAERMAPRDLADWLLARGRHWVTVEEAALLLGVPRRHVAPSLARWIERGEFFSPTKGAYVPIPPQYRGWGAVPAAEFVDQVMTHLGHRYYVCLLSAAEVHGFAHQRPQVFQVMVEARLRDRSFGRVSLSFVSAQCLDGRPVVRRNTPTGQITVSTLETTIFDMVSMPLRCGGLSNVATLLIEIIEEGAVRADLIATAASFYPGSVRRRVGWMIDVLARRVGVEVRLDSLAAVASVDSSVVQLDPSKKPSGALDGRWRVRVNAELEPDL